MLPSRSNSLSRSDERLPSRLRYRGRFSSVEKKSRPSSSSSTVPSSAALHGPEGARRGPAAPASAEAALGELAHALERERDHRAGPAVQLVVGRLERGLAGPLRVGHELGGRAPRPAAHAASPPLAPSTAVLGSAPFAGREELRSRGERERLEDRFVVQAPGLSFLDAALGEQGVGREGEAQRFEDALFLWFLALDDLDRDVARLVGRELDHQPAQRSLAGLVERAIPERGGALPFDGLVNAADERRGPVGRLHEPIQAHDGADLLRGGPAAAEAALDRLAVPGHLGRRLDLEDRLRLDSQRSLDLVVRRKASNHRGIRPRPPSS